MCIHRNTSLHVVFRYLINQEKKFNCCQEFSPSEQEAGKASFTGSRPLPLHSCLRLVFFSRHSYVYAYRTTCVLVRDALHGCNWGTTNINYGSNIIMNETRLQSSWRYKIIVQRFQLHSCSLFNLKNQPVISLPVTTDNTQFLALRLKLFICNSVSIEI